MNIKMSYIICRRYICVLVCLVAALGGGCAQTTYWVKSGGSSEEFDRTQAACNNQAAFLPRVEATRSDPGYIASTVISPLTRTAYTTLTPYRAPYQNMADAFGNLATSFVNIARQEQYVENCMVANGWKKVQETKASVTGSTYAVVGNNRVVYEGTGTGYLDRTGTLKVKSATGNVCVGSFRYTTSYGGTGNIRCDSGETAEIQFRALTHASGYGWGTTNMGETVKFVYGIDGSERENYLR